MTGDNNTSDAYTLYEKASERMAGAGFKLRKWLTNDSDLREKIRCREKLASGLDNYDADHKHDETESYAK